jgi:dipeptidyl aminopeptidase/acylaminoacyl peptidase
MTLAGGGLIGPIEVRFGDRVAGRVRRLSLTALEVVTPPGEPGPTDVWVINKLFGSAMAPVAFTYAPTVPTITQARPATLLAGSGESILHLDGTGFGATASVLVNGTALPAVHLSAEHMEVRLPAALLATARSLEVRIQETGPGDDASNLVTVPILNPVPAITTVEVPPAAAQATATTVTVRGTGFRPDSRIRLADVETDTRYRSGEELEGTLPLRLLVQPDAIPLQVVTPAPGGGISNPWVLRVVSPPPPPPPPPISGRYVAFTSNRDGGRNHIFLLDRQTKILDKLDEANSVGGSDAYPSISADGRFIVFQSNRHRGQQDILLFDRETRALDPLPEANHPSAFDGFPKISPDGRVIVFESDRLKGKPKIFVFDRETRTLSELSGANDAAAEDGLATISN